MHKDLREQWIENGWTIDIFPVRVERWGFMANLTSAYLTKLALSPQKKKKKKKKKRKEKENGNMWSGSRISQKHHLQGSDIKAK